MYSMAGRAHQLLIEAHLCQVLLEDLAVHVYALLTDVVVPVHLGRHTFPSCAQNISL